MLNIHNCILNMAMGKKLCEKIARVQPVQVILESEDGHKLYLKSQITNPT